ncbi:MAG: hypothetical protein M0017_10170 [Desulfobacteraceae bacterium]|nr:hypothetical protein [Desulfobacteraceae bacterium]
MEFFAIAEVATSPEAIRERITLPALPDFCESFALIDALEGESCEAETVWGRFRVDRQEIMGGLRFTMPGCPNCFAWTVTTGLPPCPDRIVIHGTINRPGHEDWFVESMEEFVAQWKAGLEARLGGGAAPVPASPRPLPGLTIIR